MEWFKRPNGCELVYEQCMCIACFNSSCSHVTRENVVVWSWWQKFSYGFSSLAVFCRGFSLYFIFWRDFCLLCITIKMLSLSLSLLMMLLLMLLLLLLVVTPLLCLCQIHQKLLPSLFSVFPLFDVCKHFGVFPRLKFMVIYRFQLFTKYIYIYIRENIP